jgi:hypothetical protein
MMRTQPEAVRYAQMLADMHHEPRIVVLLTKAQAGSGRAIHGIKGRYYGGVSPAELPEFIRDGAIECVTVTPQEASK